jgi:hypothetical protein
MKFNLNIRVYSIPCILTLLMYSCNNNPKDVQIVLNAAGDNRKELEKVIDHYKSTGEREKLRAAYFLIGNMDNKYAVGGEELRKYDPLFNFFKDLNEKNLPVFGASAYVDAKWDSMVSVVGPFHQGNKNIIADFRIIKAENLIKDIDLAFSIRDSVPWGKQLSFDQFCEFVLSYRFNHEPLEEWRTYFHNKYRTRTDTIRKDSCYRFAVRMHQIIPRVWGSGWFMQYPFDFWIEQMEASQMGACEQIATYRAQLFRAEGIPTAIDFTLNWGNHGAGHTWNTIFAEKGKPIHYEGTALEFGQELVYKAAKVYRKTFGRQKIYFNGNEKEIPPDIRNYHMIDVTSEYTKTADISVPLKYMPNARKMYAVICSHNNKVWVPQDWGEVWNNKAHFRNMGVGNIYNVMYFENGRLYSANDPFILNEKGEIIYTSADEGKLQVMKLLRKYPIRKSIQAYNDGLVGCYFQGANRSDFKDSVILHTITASMDQIVPVNINNPGKFRYVRFKSPIPFKGDIAEAEFYGGDRSSDTLKLSGKMMGYPEVPKSFGTLYQNALDGDIDTYFHGYWDTKLWWAGLDLGEPKMITKIKYCPRSDTNFIVEGDKYELCYWKMNKWISMGVQVAKRPLLEYTNVPSDGLYILHNLSRGKEERIFTWEEGKQVFW